MKLSYSPQLLYFKKPFKIAHGVRDFTPVVFTRIEQDNFGGFGEACMPPYLGETHESCIAFLEKAKKLLDLLSWPFDLEETLQAIDQIAEGNTAAKASIDIALHDLTGKLEEVPCWKMFGLEKKSAVSTTYTLGITAPGEIRDKITESDGFPILKVKLNGEQDRIIIDSIRKLTDKPIAVDVNQGWQKKEEALEMIGWLATKNVLFVEQPLNKNSHVDARWLFERSPLPIYADESVQRIADIDTVKDCFHGINIKLMKCTGLHEAHQMILKARELNLKVLIGCMSESSCGVSAAAQLSPLADLTDLDGPLLIRNDPFRGISFENGKIVLKDEPGIGVQPLA
jgi:L-Ala-D/L-Glu epimerase